MTNPPVAPFKEETIETELPDNPGPDVEALQGEMDSIRRECAKTVENAEQHFRNYRAKLEAQIREKDEEMARLKSTKAGDADEVEGIKEKFNALKEGVLKELKDYRDVLVRHKISSQDEVNKNGIGALNAFLLSAHGQEKEERQKHESASANLQRKINDLEAKNQNLLTMVEYAKESNDNPEFRRCREYIKELEERLSKANEGDFNKLKDECIMLKAENCAFSQEINSLQNKLKNLNAFQSQQTSISSHPLFLQNFVNNLDGLLQDKEERVPQLEEKYIQTADKTTKPIFQRIVELKTTANAQKASKYAPKSPASSEFTTVPIVQQPAPAEAPRKQKTTHRNYTYERQYEEMETLENVIFEQEDYIRKLELNLDRMLLQNEPQRV